MQCSLYEYAFAPVPQRLMLMRLASEAKSGIIQVHVVQVKIQEISSHRLKISELMSCL